MNMSFIKQYYIFMFEEGYVLLYFSDLRVSNSKGMEE
jgi:hypothetical protein